MLLLANMALMQGEQISIGDMKEYEWKIVQLHDVQSIPVWREKKDEQLCVLVY